MNNQTIDSIKTEIHARADRLCAELDAFFNTVLPDPTLPATNPPREPTPRLTPPRRRGNNTTRPVPNAGRASPSGKTGKRGEMTRQFRRLISAQPGEFTDRQLLAQVPDSLPAYRDKLDIHWIQSALFREKKAGLIEQLSSNREHGQTYRRVKNKEDKWAEFRASLTVPTAED
jgi:hypothetical protein